MKISAALKKAVLSLPTPQKDEILLKLLSQNQSFAEKLEHKLLNNLTVEELRERLFTKIDNKLQDTKLVYTPGQIQMLIRELVRKIDEHVELTNDTYGEADLVVFILTEILKKHSASMSTFKYPQVKNWCVLVVAKTFKALLLTPLYQRKSKKRCSTT